MGVFRKTRIGFAAAALACVGLVGISSPAEAIVLPKSRSVTVYGPDQVVTCKLTVNGWNATYQRLNVNLAASSKPRSFSGYFNNKVTYVGCYAIGLNNPDSFAAGEAQANGPTASFNKRHFVEYASAFQVCAYGATIKSNGTTTQTPFGCNPA